MRLIISITCLAVCLAVVASKKCDSADDCGEGECCAVNSRDLSRKGRCLKLGRNRARCNKPEAKLDYYGGKFSKYCPCQEDIECVTGKVENGIGRCKSTATTSNPDEPEEKPEEPEEKPEEPEEEPEESEEEPEEPEEEPEE